MGGIVGKTYQIYSSLPPCQEIDISCHKLNQNGDFVSKYPSSVAAILKLRFRDHVTPIFQLAPISDLGPQSRWASTCAPGHAAWSGRGPTGFRTWDWNRCQLVFRCHTGGSWSKRPHSKTATPKMATKLFATKTATTEMATLHLVKTATEEGSLPKRPHCIWSKRPQREDHYQNGHTAFGQKPRRDVHYQNGHTIAKMATETLHMIPERGRITTKTATQLQNGHRDT